MNPGATADVLERRKEPRSPAQGVVQLLFEDPAPQVINAELRDVSASGFRAVHHCSTLSSGLEVRFTHDLGHGRARVVWTLDPARRRPERVPDRGILTHFSPA